MILFLLAAAAAPQTPTTRACPDLVTPPALICRAIAAQSEQNFAASAQAFEQAANASSADESVARIWAAAGNMWIAAGDNGRAAVALDKALALPGLIAEQRGEALLDRARVAEAQNDLKTARAKLDAAMATVGDDPFAWYFAAALAIREGDVPKAQIAINKALTLAPNDALVLFEAGHVAQAAGNAKGARDYWQQSSAADAQGAVGAKAREAIRLLDNPPKDDAKPPKP